MRIKDYYRDKQSLQHIEDPYLGVVEMLDPFYLTPPQGCKSVSVSSFPLPIVMSAVRTICEELKAHQTFFLNTLVSIYDRISDPGHVSQMTYERFTLNNSYHLAIIFGAVYFAMASDLDIHDVYLNAFERVAVKDEESRIVFAHFKMYGDLVRERIKKVINSKEDEKNKKFTTKESNTNSPQSKGNKIVIAKEQGNNFVRAIHAMALEHYFMHEDGTSMTPTEVGTFFLKWFGYKSSWKAMLQSAYKADRPIASLESLCDTAKKYWTERFNIKEEK